MYPGQPDFHYRSSLEPMLRSIVSTSSPIFERLGQEYQPGVPIDPVLLDNRLGKWANSLDEAGNRDTLQRYFDWEGLDPDQIQRMLSPVSLLPEAALPDWACLLGEVLECLLPDGNPPANELQLPSIPHKGEKPDSTRQLTLFEQLFTPFIRIFLQKAQGSPGWDRLTSAAQAQLCQSLTRLLSNLSAETLYLEFQVFRRRQPFGELALALARSGEVHYDLYRRFTHEMLSGGWEKLWLSYPVLARLMGQAALFWMDAQLETLARLEDDLPHLQRRFANGAELGQVREFRLGLSDPHLNGRSVVIFTFANDLHLVYKPHPLAMESAWFKLLAWINDHNPPLPARVLQVLDLGDHGWVEFTGPGSCSDWEAVGRYYQRVGNLLALLYALAGTDCHMENLIAAGEYPVIVDCETLFYPQVHNPSTEGSSQAEALIREKLGESVLVVGLLPGWIDTKDPARFYDLSGLGGSGGQGLPFRQAHWFYPNSDAMQVVFEPGSLPSENNLPMLSGAPVHPEGFTGRIITGYREMHEYLLERKEQLLESGGPIEAFKDLPGRFVFRATQVYALLLKEARQPRNLQDGVEYSLSLERLSRAFLMLELQHPAYVLLKHERSGLYRQDIPYFSVRTSGRMIYPGHAGPDAGLEDYFRLSGYDHITERLQSLSTKDLHFQAWLAESSLAARYLLGEHILESARPSIAVEASQANSSHNVDLEQLLQAALKLGKQLVETSVQGQDGSVTWMGIRPLAPSNRFGILLCDSSLYDGLAGIALFLSALVYLDQTRGLNIVDAQHLRQLSLAALAPLRKGITSEQNGKWIADLGLGTGQGLGGWLFALAHCGRFLNEPALIDEACQVAVSMTPAQVQSDQALDVIAGAAGGILGLLALHRELKQDVLLERAVWCGEHLLEKQAPVAPAGSAWLTIAGRPLAGFSHGAAGIAYALLRLYQVCGEVRFLQAAKKAISYETALFDPGYANWPDLRDPLNGLPFDPAHPEFVSAWRHGASGIGLARLGTLSILDTQHIQRDISAALETTRSWLWDSESPDLLCCGKAGQIELLLSAGLHMGQPEWIAEARLAGLKLVKFAENNGGWRYHSRFPRGLFDPGLFTGAAGVGYQLLRLVYPTELLNVLLWE